MLTTRDNSTASFYSNYCNKSPNFHCCICCILLYHTQVKFRKLPKNASQIPCLAWGFPPILNDAGSVAVCTKHLNSDWHAPFPFPGHVPLVVRNLNYLELACLSPIKVMSLITRGKSSRSITLGHYHCSGDIWMDYNYLFSGMMFDGSLGLYYNDHDRNCTYITTAKLLPQQQVI